MKQEELKHLDVKPVQPKDVIPFSCRLCGDCCRNVENSVMLDAFDAYRLGQYLREKTSMVSTIEDVFSWFTHPQALENGYPVFVLNTCGEHHACTFLEQDRCSVYDARPRVCRLYPFTVFTGGRGRNFAYFQCMDRNMAHFSPVYGERVSVEDWFYQNFSKDDRAYFLAEAKALPELGRLIRAMGPKAQRDRLFQILYYRYFNFDLGKPFLEQYQENQKALMEELQAATGR